MARSILMFNIDWIRAIECLKEYSLEVCKIYNTNFN